ncbi:ATP-binding protein [Streptomyces sp. NPDC051453]|uniref:ATP-binding protein n=1 Tax=Streptomyces sp. NPDC051453 TaxID=3154941 RepID=UPI003442305C
MSIRQKRVALPVMADLLGVPQTVTDGSCATTRSRPGVLEIDLQVTAAAVSPVREIVVGHLRFWGLASCEWQVGLAVSELLTNAYKHARRAHEPSVQARLVLSRIPGGLFLCVSDPEKRHPNFVSAGQDDEGGRGVALLRSIGGGFGCSTTSRGKDVWVTFPTP